MLFSQILALSLVSSVFAAPYIVKRDLATITGQIDEVNKMTEIVASTIAGLTAASGVAAATATLTSQSADIMASLNSGAGVIAGTSALSLPDALALNDFSNALVANVDKVVDAFIAKKDIIVAGGQGATVVSQLQAQKSASGPFIDALVSKVPAEAASIAKSQADRVITSLDRGIAAFA